MCVYHYQLQPSGHHKRPWAQGSSVAGNTGHRRGPSEGIHCMHETKHSLIGESGLVVAFTIIIPD